MTDLQLKKLVASFAVAAGNRATNYRNSRAAWRDADASIKINNSALMMEAFWTDLAEVLQEVTGRL